MYKIVRMYANQNSTEIVETGLTLEEARKHCKSPETSSRTCTSREGLEREKAFGPWFEGYEEEGEN